MGTLSQVSKDESVKEDGDSLGAGFMVESGIYPCDIEMAYVKTTPKGSIGVHLHLKTDSGAVVRTALWVQSSKAKGGSNQYKDKDGNKHYIPGFNQAEAVSLLTVGKHLDELASEEKVIKLYDFGAKAEVPTKVEVLTELLNEKITIGFIKEKLNKSSYNDQTKTYDPLEETFFKNEIDKVFRTKDNLTVAEIRNGIEKAEFKDAWESKWKDKIKDKTVDVTGMSGATSGAPKVPDGKPAKSLFT